MLCVTLRAMKAMLETAPYAGIAAPKVSAMMVLSALSPLHTAAVQDMSSGKGKSAAVSILTSGARSGEPSGTPSAKRTITTKHAASAHQIARLD